MAKAKMKYGTLGFDSRLLKGKPVKDAIQAAQNYLGMKISLEVFHGVDGVDGLIIERNRWNGRPKSIPAVVVDVDFANSRGIQAVFIEAILELHDQVATARL